MMLNVKKINYPTNLIATDTLCTVLWCFLSYNRMAKISLVVLVE